MNIESTRQEIESKRASYVEALRVYALAQVEDWKRIPWLALQAEGRSGFTDEGASRYGAGYLRLVNSGGSYRIFLDLDTGELCNSFYPIKLAPDPLVMQLTPEDLTASKYIVELEERARRPTISYYDPAKQEEWRQQKIKQYGLTERYERQGPREDQTPFQWD